MAKLSQNISIPEEYREIAPYTDKEFKEKTSALVNLPGFEESVKFIGPEIDYPSFRQKMLSVDNQEQFQKEVMAPFLMYLEQKTTSGIRIEGVDNISSDKSYTYITNHRDIVLDASFLNLELLRSGKPMCQVAIGDNLLIFDWITDLVKLNKSFIVKRGLKMLDALQAARQLSGYIHFAINQLHESVWIAQRQGRAKDSNDLTQESLVKMLSLEGGGTVKENLLSINLCPIAISYEYDPNDFLKAAEFLQKRRDPQFKKSKNDDLFSMRIGLMKQKGHITYRVGKCINEGIEAIDSDNRSEIIRRTCQLIDREIHCGYEIYPCNYISYDEVNDTKQFADQYTQEDVAKFDEYINTQLNKVRVPDITPEEREYMRKMMLTMYANPLKNMLQSNCMADKA